MAVVLAFRWRTSALAPQTQWKRGTEEWASGTVDALRVRLAVARGSSADLAADVDPELWLCDDDGAPTKREPVRTSALLAWTPATCPRTLVHPHPNGEPQAILLFTFPPVSSALTYLVTLVVISTCVLT